MAHSRDHVAASGLCRVLSLVRCPCDGYLGVTGYVYELVRPTSPAAGLVLVDSERSTSAEQTARPIGGCAVTLEPWPPGTRPGPEATQRLARHATSDAKGQFTVGGPAKPGTYDATLSITCENFTSVTRIFRHDRQTRHEVIVRLTRVKAGEYSTQR